MPSFQHSPVLYFPTMPRAAPSSNRLGQPRNGGAWPILPTQSRDQLLAQGRGPLEKRNLKVGFIPITCATPIIMAHPMGFYAKHGLDVEVVKTAGWAVVRDKTLNGNTMLPTCWPPCR